MSPTGLGHGPGSSVPTSRSASGLLGGLLGDSLQVFACPGDSVAHSGSAVIGPAGGRIAFGPHILIIPPAALLSRTTITATDPGNGHVSAVFAPEGLHFLVPAALSLNFGACTPAPDAPTIVYLPSLLGRILQILPSQIDLAGHTVIAPITHFSVYAVAD
jgi:hypothetical protein